MILVIIGLNDIKKPIQSLANAQTNIDMIDKITEKRLKSLCITALKYCLVCAFTHITLHLNKYYWEIYFPWYTLYFVYSLKNLYCEKL